MRYVHRLQEAASPPGDAHSVLGEVPRTTDTGKIANARGCVRTGDEDEADRRERNHPESENVDYNEGNDVFIEKQNACAENDGQLDWERYEAANAFMTI